MNTFYRLQKPFDDEEYPVYGQPIWRDQFGLAEWSNEVDLPGIVCPVDPGHQRAGNRTTDLTVILPVPRFGDFVWTWQSECLMTDRVLKLFQDAAFTGFEPRPVSVEKVQRVRKGTEVLVPQLWELKITGKGGDAHRRSRIRIIERCNGCGMVRYSSFRRGIVVDERNWDGSDFFTVNGYPRYILITERVKQLVIRERLVNCALVPSHELKWKSFPRPEDDR